MLITQTQEVDQSDYTRPTKFLFKYGNNVFYGHKNVVYDSIIMLRKRKNSVDTYNDFVLDSQATASQILSKEIINRYIDSCYIRIFDINVIEPQHFMNFIKFIDQYPTTYLSIDILENQIIRYMEKNEIKYNDYLDRICDRYKLVHMFLDIHNKKII